MLQREKSFLCPWGEMLAHWSSRILIKKKKKKNKKHIYKYNITRKIYEIKRRRKYMYKIPNSFFHPESLIQRDLMNSSFGKSIWSCYKGFVNGVNCDFIVSHMKTLYTFCIQKLCKMYTTDAYAKSISHFSKLLYAFCI